MSIPFAIEPLDDGECPTDEHVAHSLVVIVVVRGRARARRVFVHDVGDRSHGEHRPVRQSNGKNLIHANNISLVLNGKDEVHRCAECDAQDKCPE